MFQYIIHISGGTRFYPESGTPGGIIGDIALDKGEPKVHAHVVVGKKNGAAMGGHLLEAHVQPTLELVLQDSEERLKRKFDPESGLTPAEFKRATEVTYLGTVYGTMAALGRMLRRNEGRIIQAGSALAYRSIPLQAAYCGAKHAIAGFPDSLRTELIHAPFSPPMASGGVSTAKRLPSGAGSKLHDWRFGPM